MIESGGAKIMVDPGRFTSGQFGVGGLDAILITNNGPDHFDEETIKDVLNKNEGVRVITNNEVARELSNIFVDAEILSDGARVKIKNLEIEAEDHAHETLYEGVFTPHNTGYHIGEALYIPGGSLEQTRRPVRTLALPIGAPWQNVSSTLAYIKTVRPMKVFPIHDGLVNTHVWHDIATNVLSKMGVTYIPLKEGEDLDI